MRQYKYFNVAKWCTHIAALRPKFRVGCFKQICRSMGSKAELFELGVFKESKTVQK